MTTPQPPRRLLAGRTALVLLAGVDLAFIIADLLLNVVGMGPLASMQVHRDRSVPEFYQYIKLGWCLALVVLLGWSARTWQPVKWAPLFAVLLLTDAATVHEQAGGWLAGALHLPAVAGLRPRDLGELVVAAAFMVPSLALVMVAWRRTSAPYRRFHVTIVALLGLLAAFGLIFDLLHSAARTPSVDQLVALLEDGGEMLAVSALLAFLVAHAASGRDVWLGTLVGRALPRRVVTAIDGAPGPPAAAPPRGDGSIT